MTKNELFQKLEDLTREYNRATKEERKLINIQFRKIYRQLDALN